MAATTDVGLPKPLPSSDGVPGFLDGIPGGIGTALDALGALTGSNAPSQSTGALSDPDVYTFFDSPIATGGSTATAAQTAEPDVAADTAPGALSGGQGTAGQRLENIALIVGLAVGAIALAKAL